METFGNDQEQGIAGATDKPFFWRVAEGVLYAEMLFTNSIRPPLLSEWESARVRQFRNPQRRNEWLAGRALAKVLVRERLRMAGAIEIREGVSGEPLVYRGGLPIADTWLSIAYRHGRVAAVIGDRPVALDVRRVAAEGVGVAMRFVSRSELRALCKVFGEDKVAVSVAWALKESALRATRAGDRGLGLEDVRVNPDYSVVVDDIHMHAMAVRIVGESVVAIVGRPLLHEQPVTRISLPGAVQLEATSRMSQVVERSVARAQRMAEARARWQRLRWQN